MPHKARKKLLTSIGPARIIVTSFFIVILVGAGLLTLPFASRSGVSIGFLNALFTATSATCVTGLIVVDTYQHWTLFGQLVILGLIQIGGLGFVTFTTFFNVALGKKLGLHSMQLAQESMSFGSFFEISRLVKMVIGFSFVIEFIGACALAPTFVSHYGIQGLYIAVFIGISAFCNAGFDILGRDGAFTSLTQYNDHPQVLIIVMSLIVIGGLGFIVWNDLFNYRKTKKLLLHTKVVLIVTGFLIVSGALIFYIFESSNPATMKDMGLGERTVASFFQSISLRTAGFNSIDMNGMNGITKLFSCFIMFIGAAPGSTGGGIKVTTFAVLIMTMISVIRNKEDTVVLRRKISKDVVYKALSVAMLAILAVGLATGVVFFSHDPEKGVSGINALFESVSGFATVGMSVGVSAIANSASKIALILTMFIGRVGPVSLMLSLIASSSKKSRDEVMPEGKILVG